MSIYSQAADALEREGARMEGLAIAAKAMKELGALDQIIVEMGKAKDVAMSAKNAAVAELAQAQADLAGANERTKQVADKAEQDAAAVMDAAVQRMQEAEQASAARINLNASEASQRAERRMAELDHQMQTVMATVRELTAQIAALKEAIIAKAVQLGDLEAKYRAAKEAAAALLA